MIRQEHDDPVTHCNDASRCIPRDDVAEVAARLSRRTHLVLHRFSMQTKRLLGVPRRGRAASEVAVKHRIRRAFERFTNVCDPFPTLSGGRRVLRRDVEALQEGLDPQEVPRRWHGSAGS